MSSPLDSVLWVLLFSALYALVARYIWSQLGVSHRKLWSLASEPPSLSSRESRSTPSRPLDLTHTENGTCRLCPFTVAGDVPADCPHKPVVLRFPGA